MEIRRLVKSGAASHTISLPKTWLDKNKLKKGDVIYISEKSDKELIISPQQKEIEHIDKEININVDEKSISSIQREITSAYINNYNTIIIHGRELDDKVRDIRKMLHDFVALEISELTSSRIIAKDLLNLQEISIEKTIRRMDMIVRSMLQDSIASISSKNMYESIYFRDFDVNKLYFLMFRILKSALLDSKIAEKFQITNTEALCHWRMSMLLENIADNTKFVCLTLKDMPKGTNKKLLSELYSELESHYLNAMKSYFNKDKTLAEKVASCREEIREKCDSYLEANNKLAVYKLISGFKELSNLIAGVARLTIDEEYKA